MTRETLVKTKDWAVYEEIILHNSNSLRTPTKLFIINGPQMRWSFISWGHGGGWQDWDENAKIQISGLIANDRCPNEVKDILILYTLPGKL